MTAEIAKIEAIQLANFREPHWYARITFTDGKTWHSDPWKTEEAALIHAAALRVSPHGFMRRR